MKPVVILEVKKALAIQCWDLICNGVLLERFDRKYEAQAALESYKAIAEA